MVKEIEGVMRHLCDGGKLSQAPSAAEESTLRRWWKEYSAKMQEWAGLLESRTYEPSCQAPALSSFPSIPSRDWKRPYPGYCLYLRIGQ